MKNEKLKNEPTTKADLKKVETGLKKEIKEVETKLSKKIEENAKKIGENKGVLDRIVLRVIENSSRLDEMVTRKEFNERMDKITTTLDKMMTILQRLDQERIFANQRISRNEESIKRLEEVVF